MSDEVLDAPLDTETEGPAAELQLPDDPTEAVHVLIAELQRAREAEAMRVDDLQRLAAEFDNFRKRSTRDQQDMTERSSQRVVEALLPVLDSFDGAFGHTAQSPSEELLLSGVRSTFHQLMEVLGREGLAMIPTEGEPFDPTIHEAVAGGGGDDLIITSEMRRGYTMRDRVLRPSLVEVAPRDESEAAQE